MKYSEAEKNFFAMKSRIPGMTFVYYVDYKARGLSRAVELFKKKGIKKWNKGIFTMVFDGKFALIRAYIKTSDLPKFEECMQELENTAPFFCEGYKEARSKILDVVIAMNA